MPLPGNGSSGGQNILNHDSNASAAPKLYLGTSSGLGFLSNGAGAALATTSSLINQTGKSTLQIRKPHNGAGAVTDYQAQGGVTNFRTDDSSQSPIRVPMH